MIAESPLMLLVCIHLCFLPEMPFRVIFFLRMFLSLHFRFFVLVLVHQVSFTLVLCVGVFDSACRVQGWQSHSFALLSHFYLKNPKIFASFTSLCIIAHCIVPCTCTRFFQRSTSQDVIQESLHLSFEENFAFHVVACPIFHSTQCICIDCQV